MSKSIDYFYTHASPWTYLGSVRIHELAKAAGATINYRPVNLGKIFPLSGGLPLGKRAEQRKRYRMFELKRWRDHLGVEITLEPAFFPVDDTNANRMVIAADKQGLDTGRLSNAMLRAVWAEEQNIADEDTVIAVANAQGMDGAALLAASKSDETGAAYDAYTEEGIERQVFGAPTYIIDGEPFWGQDRLDFVERALAWD
ncbi:MAG: 2-hydroxychromene-2-carboxylate isomerase [Alphaproteobacteria bacterium]|nr:2-hydroxychromene-2-carboxylate isomerase [Alphaproteobacteria bacterium]